jgi:ABC-2 type transport system permease protein
MFREFPIYKISVREIKRIGKSKTLYLLLIILPILLFIFLSFIYKNGVARDLPVAVFDEDRSELSRLITRSIDATASMQVIKSFNSIDEIKSGFRKGLIQGAVYFPADFEKNVKTGKNSTVVVFKNTSSLVIGNLILKDASTTIRTISAGALLKKLQSRNMHIEKAMNIVNPVRVETHYLFNPAYNYFNYLVPGVLPMFLQMIIMVSSALLMNSEFNMNTYAGLYKIANGKITNIIIGKALPHILINTVTVFGIIGIIFPLFGVQIEGSIFILLGFFLLFIAASFALGFAISCIFNSQLMATEAAVFINTPAFIFSGFTFPNWSMPPFHRLYAQLSPFTHFLQGYIKVYQMGAPFKYIMPQIESLLLFLVPSLIVSYVILRVKSSELKNLREN